MKAARRSSSMPSFVSLSKVTVYFGSDPVDSGCCSVSCSLPPSSVYSEATDMADPCRAAWGAWDVDPPTEKKSSS